MNAAVISWVLLACLVLDSQAQVKTNRKEAVNVPTEALGKLTYGMSQAEEERFLQARGNHQFTAKTSNVVLRCIAYYRSEIFGEYYLVFTNGHLSKVCEPPPTEMKRVPYQDTWANLSMLGDPEVRIAKVLNAPDMIGPPLVAALKPARPPKRSWDPGLTAAFLLTKRLFTNKAREAEERRTWEVLLERYDPFRTELGMTVEAVETRLGKPQITEALEPDRSIRYYGNIKYGLSGSRELMWLAVVYEKGQVIRVLSHDFVDFEKIRTLEENARKATVKGS